MPAEIVSISHSRVDSYLRCRRQNYYGYVQRLEKKASGDGLYYGKASHAVLEAYYEVFLQSRTAKAQRRRMPEARRAALQAMAQLEAEGYVDPPKKVPLRELIFDWYIPNEPLVRNGYIILATEQAYNLKVNDEMSYLFIVDLIVQDPKGRIAVVDHKNMYNFIAPAEAALLPQIPKYIGALRALGKVYPEYGIYNQLRTRVIRGTKKPDGTYPGPTLDQMLNRFNIEPSDQRIIRTFEDQIEVAEEILWLDQQDPETQDRVSWRTGDASTCQRCPFRTLCAADLEGSSDATTIRDAFFRVKDPRESIDITEDDIEED